MKGVAGLNTSSAQL